MTVLSVVQNACALIKNTKPDSVVNSSDTDVMQMLAMLKVECAVLASRYAWHELQREHTITLQANVSRYAQPLDLGRWIHSTSWDSSRQTDRVRGPLTPQEYQARVRGIIEVTVSKEWRMQGATGKDIVIYPTPATGDVGTVLSWEYQSNNPCRPALWQQGRTYNAGQYVWWLGNIYASASGSGATSGATPPTHVAGTVSDGGVLWTYQPPSSFVYDRFLRDDDGFLLDELLITLGLVYRWTRENGLDYQANLDEYRNRYLDIAGARKGAKVVTFQRNDEESWWEACEGVGIPDNGYGEMA